MEPDNLVGLKDATGLDLTIKGAAARDKQLAEWEEMQAGDGPIPDPEATLAKEKQKQQAAQQAVNAVAPGAEAPPVPEEPIVEVSSVPIRLADDHIEESRTCVRILNDSKTLEMLTTRPEVVKDLELHLVAHLTKAQKSGIAIPPDLLGIIEMPPAPRGIRPPAPTDKHKNRQRRLPRRLRRRSYPRQELHPMHSLLRFLLNHLLFGSTLILRRWGGCRRRCGGSGIRWLREREYWLWCWGVRDGRQQREHWRGRWSIRRWRCRRRW